MTFRVGKFIGQVSIESERLSREKRAVVVVDISRREVPPAALVVPVDLPADVHHRPLHLLAHRQQGQQPRGPRLQDEGGQPAVEGNPID